MKKILTFALFSAIALITAQSCKKTQNQIDPIEQPELSTTPIDGLVVLPYINPMSMMISDIDQSIEDENERMNLAALSFQQIACDPGFETAIGLAVNSDLEFDVELFLANNGPYEQTVTTYLMNTHGKTVYDVFGDGANYGMWAYACNYGVHEQGAPTLALSIELDDSHTGDRDDFIPCYYSLSGSVCNDYQEGLLGLETDLDPEDPILRKTELTIIFESTVVDFANYKTDLGKGSDNSGTVITGSTGPSCPEYWLHYNFEDFQIHSGFSSGKKMKIAARFSTWEFCPASSGSGAGGKKVFNELIKLNKGKVNDLTGTKTQLLNFNGKTIYYYDSKAIGNGYPRNNWASTGGQSYVNWGIVFERDFFSLKKKYVMTCNGQEVKVKARMRKKKELYASFYFDGDWCQRTVIEFKNRPGVGDQNSFVRIGTSTSTFNFDKHKYN